MSALAPWWGATGLADDEVRHWRLGPSEFWLARQGQELVISRLEGEDPLDASLLCGELAQEPPYDAQRRRWVVDPAQQTVRLTPRVADRPVVVRADEPLLLSAGQQATLYVSTPGWLELSCGSAVDGWPLVRLTDTWFGPDTLTGDLGYASATRLRLDVDQLVQTPHRLFTRVELTNGGDDVLALRRIRMPLPRLAVYGCPDGRLWTDSLVVRRRSGPAQADVEVVSAPPVEHAVRLSEPRVVHTGPSVLSLFTLGS